MPNGVHIGIVKFSSSADIVQDMMKVETTTDRQNIISQLNTLIADGSTGIGSGILKAIEVQLCFICVPGEQILNWDTDINQKYLNEFKLKSSLNHSCVIFISDRYSGLLCIFNILELEKYKVFFKDRFLSFNLVLTTTDAAVLLHWRPRC